MHIIKNALQRVHAWAFILKHTSTGTAGCRGKWYTDVDVFVASKSEPTPVFCACFIYQYNKLKNTRL